MSSAPCSVPCRTLGSSGDGTQRSVACPHGGRPRAYCQLAASFGGRALEPICRYEIDSIHTTDQAIDLCERAGKPANLGLLLDLFHMNIEEASVCGAICRAGSLVRHVHFVDNTRAVPGMGCMALSDVVACLKAVGYEGFLGIEAIPGSDPEGEARSGLAFTRALGV
ncbi:MAG: TIM barrel protein [Bilophila wadsworthia]